MESDAYLLDGRDVLRWNVTTHDDVLEIEVLARLRVLLHGLDVTNDTTVLTSTTTLLLVRIVEVSALVDGFAVSDTGLASGTFHVVLAAHTFNVDLKMEFTHTRYNCLHTVSLDSWISI